jgi:N-acetylmuramoyl-L-alanine amidase
MKRHSLLQFIPLILLACILLACGPSAPKPEPSRTETPTASPAPLEEAVITLETAAAAATLPPAPTPTPTPEPTPTPSPTPTPRPLEGITIGIDPGHQRIYNPKPEPVAPGSGQTKQKVAGGCRGVNSKVYEYEVVQNVGLYLKALLEELGATVVITHETLDVNISNAERAQMFNDAGVDLGIRLHCNKSDKRETRGAFMLVPTEGRTKFYDYNVAAARTILQAYVDETGIPICGKDGMTYRSDQTGFNWCTRPIINIEMGHLSNPDDDRLLSDEAFQKTMAQGLCNGIVQFFAENGRAPDRR